MKKITYTLVLLLFFACIALANGPTVGKEAPNLMGRTLDGKLYRLSKDKGKPKVINFFWVFCKPCKEELPELADLEKKYRKVEFISVHTEDMSKDKIEAFLKGLKGYPSNIVLSNGGMKGQFKYVGLPHTVVLDKENIVRLNISGYTEENMKKMEKALKGL